MTHAIIPSLPSPITRQINLIVIHCSATASGKSISTDKKTAAQIIDDWHAQRGFKRTYQNAQRYNPTLHSIGYHYIIDVDGHMYPGRHLNEIGAHVKGHNAHSVGVCMVGGKERDGKYTSEQWDSLAVLVRGLSDHLNIPIKFSREKGICGHRDLSPDLNGNGVIEPNEWLKTCPGFSVKDWLQAEMHPFHKHMLYKGGSQ